MVEATGAQDGGVQYASFRTDKQPDPGYSADLMDNNTPQDCYDDFSKLSTLDTDVQSILGVFLKQVAEKPNHRFMGTRVRNADGTYGAYEWMTYQQVNTIYEEVARGCKALRLLEPVPGVNEDGKEWAFAGIWSKNRWEWHTTLIAGMAWKATTIGFYDSMSYEAVDYILNQTKCETMFCTSEYLKKLLDMKDDGKAVSIKNIVMYDTDE